MPFANCLPAAGLIAILLLPPAYSDSAADQYEHARSLGQKLYAEGKFGAAILAFDRAIRASRENVEAYRGRGLSYLRIGNIDRAVNDFNLSNQALGPYREQKFPGLGSYLDWKRAHEIYEDGNQYLSQENYDQAISLYKTALSVYPTFPQCLHNLGIATGKKGDHKQSLQYCLEAISYRQSDWKFWQSLALEWHALGNYKLSLKALDHARGLHPPLPDDVGLIEMIENVKDAWHKTGSRAAR